VIFLSNAVKFTPEGGEVLILARKDPNAGVRLRISNTGIGMTEEEISTAFDSFVQSDSSLARKYEGSGMGLPMARSMARLQGADVALASEPGVGTMATLQIPIAWGVEPVPSPPRTPRWYRIRWANRLNPPPIQTSLTVKAC
jgi:signal transduction histidine kinase